MDNNLREDIIEMNQLESQVDSSDRVISDEVKNVEPNSTEELSSAYGNGFKGLCINFLINKCKPIYVFLLAFSQVIPFLFTFMLFNDFSLKKNKVIFMIYTFLNIFYQFLKGICLFFKFRKFLLFVNFFSPTANTIYFFINFIILLFNVKDIYKCFNFLILTIIALLLIVLIIISELENDYFKLENSIFFLIFLAYVLMFIVSDAYFGNLVYLISICSGIFFSSLEKRVFNEGCFETDSFCMIISAMIYYNFRDNGQSFILNYITNQ